MLTPIEVRDGKVNDLPDSPLQGIFQVRIGSKSEHFLSYNSSWSDYTRNAILAWRDSPDWAKSRSPSPGRYVAILNGRVAYAGSVSRPCCGAITAHGTAAIADIGFDIRKPRSELWVLTPRGKPARHISFKSGPNGIALSPGGQHLLVGLCNGDEGDGNAKLILFDVESGSEIWRLNTYASARFARINSREDTITVFKTLPVTEFLQRRLRLSQPIWIDPDFSPAHPHAPWL